MHPFEAYDILGRAEAKLSGLSVIEPLAQLNTDASSIVLNVELGLTDKVFVEGREDQSSAQGVDDVSLSRNPRNRLDAVYR